eukprot:1969058-Alexandrium_andersonii.AAC.1
MGTRCQNILEVQAGHVRVALGWSCARELQEERLAVMAALGPALTAVHPGRKVLGEARVARGAPDAVDERGHRDRSEL